MTSNQLALCLIAIYQRKWNAVAQAAQQARERRKRKAA